MKQAEYNLHRAIMAYIKLYKNNVTIINGQNTKAFQKRIDRVVEAAKELKDR